MKASKCPIPCYRCTWSSAAGRCCSPGRRSSRWLLRPLRNKAIHHAPPPVHSGVGKMASPGERLPDDALLAGLGAGDAELAVAFVRRFQRIVFGVAVAVTGD